MKRRISLLAITVLMVLAFSSVALAATSPASAKGATQISGVGFFDAEGECADPEGAGSDLALIMTGDLEGCLYAFVGNFESSSGGLNREWGTEIFVGTYKGQAGTFGTNYYFKGLFGESGQIAGGCLHPLVEGSGTGVFDGVRGRFNIIDNIEDGVAVDFPYRGRLQW